jgi:hypothetical protein
MKKTFLTIIFLYANAFCFSQFALSSTFTKDYIEIKEGFICDTSIIDIIINKQFSVDSIEIVECGMVYEHLKQNWWDCLNKDGELVCQRFYSNGTIKREIRYSNEKITLFVEYCYIPEMLDDFRELAIIKKRKYFLSIDFAISFNEDGTLKSKYQNKQECKY